MRSRPHVGAVVLAVTFAAWSMWPTLLPRGWTMQAIVTGVSAALGWGIGSAADRLIGHALRRLDRSVDPDLRRRILTALTAVMALALLVVAVQWSAWQNDQRDQMGMPSIAAAAIVPALLAAVVIAVVLVGVGRVVATASKGIDRQVARVLPSGWARAGSIVVVVLLVVVTANLAGDRFVSWADSSFGLVNEGTADGVEQPSSSSVSGGPGSLVEWSTLGLQGRSFVAGVSDHAEALATPPIRVYAGIDSAGTIDERTDLVLDELDRTGAWEREVLVVATATGTGWINPEASRSIEAMYGGDTAIASLQYSFFPSWVAFLIDTSGAGAGGIALFDAVHERWSALDPDDRPRLLVFGESLGSFGAEAAFDEGDLVDSFAAMVDRSDGALLVGPTAGNALYGGLVERRDPGSPSWRPELASAPNVRSAITVDDIAADDATWQHPRVLYLHWPTDGVGTWRPSSLWSPPGWTRETDAPGLVDATRWFPVVTWVQETGDLMAGFSAVPGFGHDYTNAFVDAWEAVAPVNG